MDFPLMLYRPGSMLEWDGENFDYLIIEAGDDAEDELKAAKKDGWSVEKPKGKAKEAPAAPGADDIKALRADYKTKFGKNAFNGWDADTLKAKLAE